jgi:hypothetical protein
VRQGAKLPIVMMLVFREAWHLETVTILWLNIDNLTVCLDCTVLHNGVSYELNVSVWSASAWYACGFADFLVLLPRVMC